MAKWHTFTQSNKCAYRLPDDKRVLGVAYAQQVYMRELGMFFVNSHYSPMWKVSHATREPADIDDAKDLLQTAYRTLEMPAWLAVDSTLVIWPPALNDGDVLIVEVEDAPD